MAVAILGCGLRDEADPAVSGSLDTESLIGIGPLVVAFLDLSGELHDFRVREPLDEFGGLLA